MDDRSALIPRDRERFDNRRVGAFLLDALVFAPFTFGAWLLYDLGAQLVVAVVALSYCFVCECTTGQTIGKAACGLRTVTSSGEIVPVGRGVLRTAARMIDHSIVGPIVLIATGAKRQRVGDLLADTVVVDARLITPPPRRVSAGHLAWPALFLAPALAALVVSAQGSAPWSYRAQADAVCAAVAEARPRVQTAEDLAELSRRQSASLRSLHVPLNWRARHERLVVEYGRLSKVTQTAAVRAAVSRKPRKILRRHYASLDRRTQRAHARLAPLGFEDCAGRSA